jgi:hypothetical protein
VIDAFTPGTNPQTDIDTLIDELILFDHVLIDGVIEKRERKLKLTGDRTGLKELDLLKRCLETLDQGKPLLDLELTEEELKPLKGFQFLSQKPLLVVLNIAEEALPQRDALVQRYADLISPGRRNLAVVCGKIEAELVDLQDEERQPFMSELGITAPATEQVIQKAYALLGLISFLTVGEPDAHAWTIRKGTYAPQAAGAIHTDIEHGFIRAEVVAFGDYDRLETMPAIKAAGKMKLEGKDYIVQDGDVILFRFNV